MTKFTAFVIIMALRLIHHPSTPASNYNAFSPTPAKLISFKGTVNKDKIFLQWSVDENQTADQFTIEKSDDGKNFQVAALAFGSDTPGVYDYKFYEKAGNQKISYRIKLINKDQKSVYSEVITIDPVDFTLKGRSWQG